MPLSLRMPLASAPMNRLDVVPRMSAWESKCAGALVGTFAGDALGMPVEGRSARAIQEEHGRLATLLDARLGRGTYTDDTQLMIASAKAILRADGVDEDVLAQAFLDHFDARRGYGQGTRTVMHLWRSHVPVEEAASRVFEGGSYGNGGAMRVAAVAVAYHDRPRRLDSMVRRATRITHAHPWGVVGAVVQGRAIAACLRADAPQDLDPVETARAAFEGVGGDDPGPWETARDRVVELLAGPPPRPAEAAEALGNDSRAHRSVPAAVYAALAHRDVFEEAVVYAVSLGGDADTIGAMAGAVAGALHGVEGIPSSWWDALENGRDGRDDVVALGRRLAGFARRDAAR